MPPVTNLLSGYELPVDRSLLLTLHPVPCVQRVLINEAEKGTCLIRELAFPMKVVGSRHREVAEVKERSPGLGVKPVPFSVCARLWFASAFVEEGLKGMWGGAPGTAWAQPRPPQVTAKARE